MTFRTRYRILIRENEYFTYVWTSVCMYVCLYVYRSLFIIQTLTLFSCFLHVMYRGVIPESIVRLLWNTHFLVRVFVSECEKSLRAFAYLTWNRSLWSISLSPAEYVDAIATSTQLYSFTLQLKLRLKTQLLLKCAKHIHILILIHINAQHIDDVRTTPYSP